MRDHDQIDVQVREGEVTLTGTLEHRSVVAALAGLCRGVDGVVAVTDSLGCRSDDTLAAGAPAGRAVPADHAERH